MARKPSFDFERRERQKAKDAKRAEKTKGKNEKKAAAAAEGGDEMASEDAGQVEDQVGGDH